MKKLRILLVDDEIMIREGFKRLFDWASHGCEVGHQILHKTIETHFTTKRHQCASSYCEQHTGTAYQSEFLLMFLTFDGFLVEVVPHLAKMGDIKLFGRCRFGYSHDFFGCGKEGVQIKIVAVSTQRHLAGRRDTL